MPKDSADSVPRDLRGLLEQVRVLYEDEDVVAVDKPAGLLVHPDGKSDEPTLVDWVRATHPQIEGVGEELTLLNGQRIERPGIVHRLDRETSGVLLVAKNQKSFLNLKQQFKSHSVKKKYHAFVYGRVTREVGSINAPLGRSRGDFRQFAAPPRGRGVMREALTYYQVLEAHPDVSLLEVSPQTGRTHQIRAHLKFIQHPVVADRVYAPGKELLLGFTRVALHASEITFRALSGKLVSVKAPWPKDFQVAERLFRHNSGEVKNNES